LRLWPRVDFGEAEIEVAQLAELAAERALAHG
jgi:hypothetical protein